MNRAGASAFRRKLLAGTILVLDLTKNLKIDSVSRLQPPSPLVLAPDQTVADAVTLMQRERKGCVVVCVDRKPVGILTERDLLKRVISPNKPLSLRLRDCMTPDPITVQHKDTVGSALKKMQQGGYRHLPVVDEAGQAVGMLSVKRIVRYLVEHFPSTIYNLPPDPEAVQQEREGA